jgi:hypothetical protein
MEIFQKSEKNRNLKHFWFQAFGDDGYSACTKAEESTESSKFSFSFSFLCPVGD